MKRLLVIAIASIAVLALAGVAYATVSEVGIFSDAPFPAADCPKTCTAIGEVTGWQTEIGAHKNPYGSNVNGQVVAFTLKLGKPSKSQQQFFVKTFGGQPEARLAVLKSHRNHKLELVAESQVFKVKPYLGSSPSFVVNPPLTVAAHEVLALTVPTWVPAFATNGQGSTEQWRSARQTCSNNTQYAAQQTLHSIDTYNCSYSAARLLFSATFVPTPTAPKRSKSRPGSGSKQSTTAATATGGTAAR